MGEEDAGLTDKVSIEETGHEVEDPDREPIEIGVPVGFDEEDQMMAICDCFAGKPCARQPCPLRHRHDP